MSESTTAGHVDLQIDAIGRALRRIGEPMTETQARALASRDNCQCKEGMFVLPATRRQMFGGAGLVAAVGMTAMLPRKALAKAPPGAIEYDVPSAPTKE